MRSGLRLSVGLPRRAAASGLADPEAGLILTSDVNTPGSQIIATNLLRDKPGVMAADLTGFDGSSGGAGASFGGGSFGAYVGFGPDGKFVARCGSGMTGLAGAGTTSILVAAGLIAGDGTIVIEVSNGVDYQMRGFWQGLELGVDIPATLTRMTSDPGFWTGTATGGYLLANQSGPAGEVLNTVPAYTSASNLRYYANQTISSR